MNRPEAVSETGIVKVLLDPTVTVRVFEYSAPLPGAMTVGSVGMGAGDTVKLTVEFTATVPELALSTKRVLLTLAGMDAVQLAGAPVEFLIVTVLLTPAGALAPQEMALNVIAVGVTVIGCAVVAVPFMVALATGSVVVHRGVLLKLKVAEPPE